MNKPMYASAPGPGRPALRRTGLAPALAMALAAATLGGCALSTPPARVDAAAPAQWQAALPHNGNAADLSGWWRTQGDPLLAQLVEAAQAASPTLAQAGARIAQSRAERTAAGAALAPNVDFAASIMRQGQQSAMPTGTTSQAALQASWELDVFGAGRAARDAAQARLDGAGAGWHEARVAVAAETANAYYSLRACQQLQEVAAQDAASRADTARLVELSARAGFTAPADAALARASAADARNRASAQRAACDSGVKGLVALSAIAEPELRQRLAAGPAGIVQPAAIAIAALPAQLLSQRPDVYNAEREVAAAAFEVGGARAQRYPRLSLSGNVGLANFRTGGQNTELDTWTIGPLALQVPVFDAGRRAANVDAAKARYDAAVLQYRASVRNAVREVEQALVTLDSTAARASDAEAALQGYRQAYTATAERQKNGLASLLDLEDARRLRLAAENTVVSLQQERSAAWVALYRAAGGGWTPSQPAPAAALTSSTNNP